MSRLPVTLVLIAALALLVSACGSSSDDDTGSTVASASDCTPAKLDTHTSGVLTVATDKPAYPPYFEDDDPTNGKGFESAVAYAIAGQLGFEKADVKWTIEPFNSSYAPGPKDFDFDLNQISITPVREKAVDFSAPYYTADQAIVALKDSDAAKATTLADLEDAEIGVQIGTTSQEAVEEEIDPSSEVLQRCCHRAQKRPGRSDRPRRADRVRIDRRGSAHRDGRRPVQRSRRRRMGCAPGQRLFVDRLRLQRGRRTSELRRARRAQQAVDEQGHGRSRTALVA
jgi:hypothetical protein